MDLEDTSTSQLRKAVIEKLKYNYAHGNLEEDEFENMLSDATNAETKNSLVPVYNAIAELPNPTRSEDEPLPVIRKKHGTLVNILSGVDRRGNWNVPKSLRMINILGGATLDLSQCDDEETVIEMLCILGGSEIIVPENADVTVEGVPILGGLEDSTAGGDGPRIKIKGIFALGGVEIRNMNKRERKKQRKNR